MSGGGARTAVAATALAVACVACVAHFPAGVVSEARTGAGRDVQSVSCDVVVAGGSTASLAAAITAAEASPETVVCFTEITDWPGGQMTAGGVPAIDFGGSNKLVQNQPASFRDFFNYLEGNPGACTVSIKCYEPNLLVHGWIMPRLAKSKNLHVYLRTAVTATSRDSSTGAVTSITAVQRTPKDPAQEYSQPLSAEVQDWYSPAESDAFSKQTLQFTGKVFIEATEFADVLVTGGFNWTQGPGTPAETSPSTLDQCGQAWTTTYYMELLPDAAPSPDPAPKGSDAGIPFPATWNEAEWMHSWTWRRSYCAGNTSQYAANVGDVTQQNLLNDLDSGYPFLPEADARAQAAHWAGGLNMTVMKLLEDRAYGSFWYLVDHSPAVAGMAPIAPRLVLNRTTSGTQHGLSKMPYLRDSRNSYGLDGFRLTYPSFDYFNTSDPRLGYHFLDTVALGNYNDDVHHLKICTYPPYMMNHTTKPYYIPFRALTVDKSPNLLVAGKTISNTFHANGATRLHPSEWTTGVAAGGTAVLMIKNGWTSTREAYENVAQVQAFLNSSAVGQPLEWFEGNNEPGILGYACGLGRCFSVAHNTSGHPLYPNGTCHHACQPLKATEWLANGAYWTMSGAGKISATQPTLLKKSTVNSEMLPPDQILSVPAGATCDLVTDTTYTGYYLCNYNSVRSLG